MDSYLKDTKDGGEQSETVGKRNIESLKHGEDIIEAICEADKLKESYQEYEEQLSVWRKGGCRGAKPSQPDLFVLEGAKSIPE